MLSNTDLKETYQYRKRQSELHQIQEEGVALDQEEAGFKRKDNKNKTYIGNKRRSDRHKWREQLYPGQLCRRTFITWWLETLALYKLFTYLLTYLLSITCRITRDWPYRRHNEIWCRRTYCRDHSTVRRPVSDYFQMTTPWTQQYPRSRSWRQDTSEEPHCVQPSAHPPHSYTNSTVLINK